jgi:hypothetical protein
VTVVDNDAHGKMTPASVDGVLLAHRIEREREGKTDIEGASEDSSEKCDD